MLVSADQWKSVGQSQSDRNNYNTVEFTVEGTCVDDGVYLSNVYIWYKVLKCTFSIKLHLKIWHWFSLLLHSAHKQANPSYV